jgi:4-hydroxy-tetrahydrodipicolinate reductase
MHPINVMVNGIPGNVAGTVARHVRADARFELLPFSLTGPEIVQAEAAVEGRAVPSSARRPSPRSGSSTAGS